MWTLGTDGLPSEDAPLVLTGHTDRVDGVGFTPDGRQLITSGADGRALVRAASDAGWPIARTLYGPEFNSLDVSPDGQTVAIGGEDGTVRFYTLDPDALFSLAKTRVARDLTDQERAGYSIDAP